MKLGMRWTSAFVGLFSAVLFLGVLEAFRISFIASAHVSYSYLQEFWMLAIATSGFLAILNLGYPTRKIKILAAIALSFIYVLLLLPLADEQTIVQRVAVQFSLALGLISSFIIGFFWRSSKAMARIFSLLAFVVSTVLLIIDFRLFPDQYFGVHEVLLASAFVGLTISMHSYYLSRTRKALKMTFGVFAFLGLVAVCVGWFAERDVVFEYRGDSQLGRAVSSTELAREYKAIAGEFFSPNPVALFKEKNGFRSFDGDLSDYNIVFVLSETTRADDTFLNNKQVSFTPNLKSFSKKSAVYENAIAPSSGTFQSVSSIFSMVPPSMSRIDLWSKHWVGELRKEGPSAVESFQQAGWDTAWIGHDFHRFFSHDKIRGFERGFDYKKLERGRKGSPGKTPDVKIANSAVKYIKDKASKRERFFLFTFFSAPHAGYHKHYKAMLGKTKRDRYRQEVALVDELFGNIMKSIKENGIEKETIVIFAGDHGEAFGEHGVHRHNGQLYRESVQVPLGVYIPGEKATRNSKPVSLFSVLAHLMLSGPNSMRKVVKQVIKDDLAPLHVAMGAGAISELIRHKKMLTRVDLEDRVLIYDHVAQRISRFEDKGEKKSLSPTKEDEDVIERIGRLRATRKRFTKKINYSPWLRFKKKK